jgi:hypothetical protein
MGRRASFMFFNTSQRKQELHSFMNVGAAHTMESHYAFVPGASTLGPILGELSFIASSYPRMGKTSNTFTFMHGKKEIGKTVLQTGVFEDHSFVYQPVQPKMVPKLPPIEPFADFLNVMNDSNSVRFFIQKLIFFLAMHRCGKNIGLFIRMMFCIFMISSIKKYNCFFLQNYV